MTAALHQLVNRFADVLHGCLASSTKYSLTCDLFRAPAETYADVARRAGADVLVEDDCEGMGGAAHMTASLLGSVAGGAPHCVLVPEFGGLAHLPDDPDELLAI